MKAVWSVANLSHLHDRVLSIQEPGTHDIRWRLRVQTHASQGQMATIASLVLERLDCPCDPNGLEKPFAT